VDECKPLALGLGLALPSAAPVRKTMWSNACSATSTLKAGAKSVGRGLHSSTSQLNLSRF